MNDRSIVNKIEALNELIIDAQPDILPFTETWPTPTNGDNNLVLSTCVHVELIDCSLSCRPSVIHLLVVYRSPASSQSVFRDEFESRFEQIALSNEKLLIVGDFNLGIRNKPNEAAKQLLDRTAASFWSLAARNISDQRRRLDSRPCLR